MLSIRLDVFFTAQDDRAIDLWEVDAEVAFQPSLPSLLPFVPVLRGGGEARVAQRAVQLPLSHQCRACLCNLFPSLNHLDTPPSMEIVRTDPKSNLLQQPN